MAFCAGLPPMTPMPPTLLSAPSARFGKNCRPSPDVLPPPRGFTASLITFMWTGVAQTGAPRSGPTPGALAVLLIAIAGVIAWQVLRLREPAYQGKRLSLWLQRYSP